MDITLHLIKTGKTQELLKLKNEIITYLLEKKFSYKSIHIIKSLKRINQELDLRSNYKSCQRIPDSESFDMKEIKQLPSLLNDQRILQKKRKLNEEEAEIEKFNLSLTKNGKDLFENDDCFSFYQLQKESTICSSSVLPSLQSMSEDFSTYSNYDHESDFELNEMFVI